MSRQPNVQIDGKKLKEVIDKNALSIADISKFVIGADKDYFTRAVRENNISEQKLDYLCEFLKVDKLSFLPSKDTKPAENKDNLEMLIVGCNQMYNVQRTILAEIKEQNLLIRDLIQLIRNQDATIKNLNSNLATNTEKVKAIFTEVKYNK